MARWTVLGVLGAKAHKAFGVSFFHGSNLAVSAKTKAIITMSDFLTVTIAKQPSLIAAVGSPFKTSPEVRVFYGNGKPVNRFMVKAFLSLVVTNSTNATTSSSKVSVPPALLESGATAVGTDGVASITEIFLKN